MLLSIINRPHTLQCISLDFVHCFIQNALELTRSTFGYALVSRET